MGTPDFSVPTLQSLIESRHEIVGVVTQPDRPKGRGKQVHVTPVKELALSHNLPVYQPTKVREEGFMEAMRALAPDLAVVVAFGQILPKDFLSLPKYGCINVHASLLPKYRGAGPIQWCVLNGETETGITTMMMDIGVDTGDMLLKTYVPIDPKETGGSLFDKLKVLGGPLTLETIDALEAGTLVATPQDNDQFTHAPMLSKEMGNIDWNKPALEIERLIRGLNPWPSAYTYLHGKMMKVWEATVVSWKDHTLDNGTILKADKEGILVQCGQDALLITSLQMQGKNKMAAGDFLRGYQVALSDQLSKQ